MQNATRTGGILLLTVLVAVSIAIVPAPSSAAEDGYLHTVQPGDNLIKICGQYRHLTGHYSLTDLLTDIRRANGLDSNFLRIGQELRIPVAAEREVPVVERRVRDGAELRGMYLTGPACGVSTVLRRVDDFVSAGGNAVVFDAKDIDGGVSYGSAHPLASWGEGRSNPVISSLDDMIGRFDRRGLYIIARMALFLDGELGRQRPDLALHDSTGGAWNERGCVWMDPAQPEVREYNLALAGELARAGVDEIQFDYVRFPTNGWSGHERAEADDAAAARRRIEVLDGFLAAARDTLEEYGVRISADLYGIMAWGRIEDQAVTGQHVPTLARHLDVICPMIYPSHFRPGFEGRRRPGDDPEYFVGEGTRRFRELVPDHVEIRPWLQAFAFGVTIYDGDYIARQVEAARAAGGHGWCLWSPTCSYQVALEAVGPQRQRTVPDPAGDLARLDAVEPPAAGTDRPAAHRALPAGLGASGLGALGPIGDSGIQEPQPAP